MSTSATGLSFQTFAAFLAAVKANVAPERLARSMNTPFRSWVGYALSEIQTIVPWYRDFNVRFIQKEDVNEFCAASHFQGPVGQIAQMFAYKPDVDCKKFYYQRRPQSSVDCWMERQRCLCPATVPPASTIYQSPYCNYVIDGENACAEPYLSGEEDDRRFKCLSDDNRIFAVGPTFQIVAAPRFPCGYVLCIQWSGINRNWVDGDLVHQDNMLQEAVEAYAEHKLFMKERQGQVSGFFDAYTDKLRLIRKRWSEEQDINPKRDCTAALNQLLPAFQPGYPTPVYGPGGGQTWLTEDGQPWIMEG